MMESTQRTEEAHEVRALVEADNEAGRAAMAGAAAPGSNDEQKRSGAPAAPAAPAAPTPPTTGELDPAVESGSAAVDSGSDRAARFDQIAATGEWGRADATTDRDDATVSSSEWAPSVASVDSDDLDPCNA
jgi:hypothetical protein